MSTKTVRCCALTNNATKCKKRAVQSKKYCVVHRKILADCVDVGQKEFIHFSPEDQGPGLIGDAWTLIAGDFTVFELRPLLLACKTLFQFFTSNQWYADLRHRRYLLITKSNHRPFISDFQDEVSKKIIYLHKPFGRTIIKDYRFAPCPLPEGANHQFMYKALFVVDSYLAARKIYRCIKPHGKQLACFIAFDTNSVLLEQHVRNESLEAAADFVLYRGLRTLQSQPTGYVENIDTSRYVSPSDPEAIKLLAELVVKKSTVTIGYTIQGNIVSFQRLKTHTSKLKCDGEDEA